MKRVRTSVVAVAVIVLLALSGAEAAPQPAAPTGEEDWSASGLPAPGAATSATPLELLVGTAAAGNVEAMNLLGVLYTLGVQVPRDYSMALYWYQKAIEGGSESAMSNLATMYLYGVGVPRDYANAFRWFGRSAVRGNVRSMYSVAVMADKGLGTSRDPRLARAMYRSAAEAGFAPAMVRVSDDYARRSGARRDLVEAYAWLQVALQSGLPEELQIAVLSKINDLGARLGPNRRDEARVRAAHLVAVVRTRALSGESEAPKAMQLSRQ
jgi:TPR repeat protein